MKVWFLGDFSVRGNSDLSLTDSPFLPGEIVICNYEGVFNEVSRFENNKVYLGQTPHSLSVAQKVGVTHFGVANNHVQDYGDRAFESTVSALKASGFEVVGFRSKDHLNFSVKLSVSKTCQVEVFFVVSTETGAYTDRVLKDGIRCCDSESVELLDALTRNRELGIISVVYVHWGETNYRYPSLRMKRLAEEYVIRGARYIIGHHPHVVQGFENIGNGYVFYSLGNFIFDEYVSRKGVLRLPDENRDSLVIGLDFAKDSLEIVRAVYDPLSGVLKFTRRIGLFYSLYTYPLSLNLTAYSIFIRFYYVLRLIKRATYWLHPSRIRQVGPRQFGAFGSMVRKLIGRSK